MSTLPYSATPAAALGRLSRLYDRPIPPYAVRADLWSAHEVDVAEMASTLTDVQGGRPDLLDRVATHLLSLIGLRDKAALDPALDRRLVSQAAGRLLALDAIISKAGYDGPPTPYLQGVALVMRQLPVTAERLADRLQGMDAAALRGFADALATYIGADLIPMPSVSSHVQADVGRYGAAMVLVHEEAMRRLIEGEDLLALYTASMIADTPRRSHHVRGARGGALPAGQGMALAHADGVRAGTIIGSRDASTMLVKIPGIPALQEAPATAPVRAPFPSLRLRTGTRANPLRAEDRLVDLLAFSHACNIVGRERRGSDDREIRVLTRRLEEWSGAVRGSLHRGLAPRVAAARDQLLGVISVGPPEYQLDGRLFPPTLWAQLKGPSTTAAQRTAVADFGAAGQPRSQTVPLKSSHAGRSSPNRGQGGGRRSPG